MITSRSTLHSGHPQGRLQVESDYSITDALAVSDTDGLRLFVMERKLKDFVFAIEKAVKIVALHQQK